MTATDNNHPRSVNSGSRDSTEVQSGQPPTRRDALSLLAAIRARDGYVTTDQLVVEFGIPRAEVNEHVDVLANAGDIEVYELGRKTVLALPDTAIGHSGGSDRAVKER